MTENEFLAEQFEEHRTQLRAVAYRMLGSTGEADDAVQEAWLRLSRTDASEVENLGGWLTTVVSRVCLNMLRSRKTRREEPFEAHVPEPIIDREDGTDPEREALLADSVGLALPDRARLALACRAPRVRAARHVRRAVRRDRPDRRPLARRNPPAREPRAATRPGRGAQARRRPRSPARGGQRVLRRVARGRLRRPRRSARPRRRAARRRRRPAPGRDGRRARSRGGRLAGYDVQASRAVRPAGTRERRRGSGRQARRSGLSRS